MADREAREAVLESVRQLGFYLTCGVLGVETHLEPVVPRLTPSWVARRPLRGDRRDGVLVGAVIGRDVDRDELIEGVGGPLTVPVIRLRDRPAERSASFVDEVVVARDDRSAARARALLAASGRDVLRRVELAVTAATRLGLTGVACETFLALSIYQIDRRDLQAFFGLTPPGVEWRVRQMLRQLGVGTVADAKRVLATFSGALVPADLAVSVQQLLPPPPPEIGRRRHPCRRLRSAA